MHNTIHDIFKGDTSKFELARAIYLTRLSELVYIKKEKDVLLAGRKLGLALEKWHWKKPGATHAAIWTSDRHTFVVFRGTNEFSDWRDNAAIVRTSHAWGKVHGGFQRALNRISDELLEALTALPAFGSRKIWLSGHSLGGALATLMAAKLYRNEVPVHGVYTYGQPEVGKRTFKERYNDALRSRTFRVFNYMDLVPRLLRGIYTHTGTPVLLLKTSGCEIDGADYTVPEKRQNRRSSSKARPRISRRDAVSKPDHAIGRYLKRLLVESSATD
ncbi:MAG TPA: lipase family protein [Kiritimatiellia bacterium]|nr:lipase family protein [Kiritimatiellia bacterium]